MGGAYSLRSFVGEVYLYLFSDPYSFRNTNRNAHARPSKSVVLTQEGEFSL